jgi:hypothetical protein
MRIDGLDGSRARFLANWFAPHSPMVAVKP